MGDALACGGRFGALPEPDGQLPSRSSNRDGFGTFPVPPSDESLHVSLIAPPGSAATAEVPSPVLRTDGDSPVCRC